jgi:uncharacterized protein (TIGR03435 family)
MRLNMALVCGVLLGLLLASPFSHAQTAVAPAPLPSFDAVSIKPNTSGSGSVSVRTTPGHFTATNVSLRSLLQTAYDIREELISGVPGTIDSLRFDVVAKIVDPDPAVMKKMSGNEWRAMMLPVLTERFHLQAHTETKTLPVFELTVVAGGPKFKAVAQHDGKGAGTYIGGSGHGLEMTAHELSMDSFVRTLSYQVRRTVIDKTGLPGTYDLALKWSREDSADTSSDASPVIFTALQEQLGLKLVSAKGPVETLVVDHVETPTEN